MTRFAILPSHVLRCGHALADLRGSYCRVCHPPRASRPKPPVGVPRPKAPPKVPSLKSLAWTPERRQRQRENVLARLAAKRAEAGR